MFTSLLSKREKLQEELRNVEKQVYELETNYLQETSNFGNAFKGFKGSFHHQKIQPKELEVGQEDGRSDLGQVRPKGGGIAINGQGKPKKGRTGQRYGKKIKMLSNDADVDAEDDQDLSLR